MTGFQGANHVPVMSFKDKSPVRKMEYEASGSHTK